MIEIAERNLRSFIRNATFRNEADRDAAMNCVDVLAASHMRLDSRVYSAVIALGGLWPPELVSGVIFYEGCQVTVAEFLQAGGRIA